MVIPLHDVCARVLKISVEGGTEHDNAETPSAVLPLGDNVSVMARIRLSLVAIRHGSKHDRKGVVEGEFRYLIVPLSTLDLEPSNILATGTVRNFTI